LIHGIAIPPDHQLAPHLLAYRQAGAAKRRQLLLGAIALLLALAASVIGAEVNPAVWWGKIGNFSSYFDRLAHLDSGAIVLSDPRAWFWGFRRWSRLLGDTILIAYVGTATGVAGAFIGCFLTSENLIRSTLVRIAVRRLLEFARSVPDIVFAMLFVIAFGLGALPGAFALAIHTTGALGKLFAEIVESIDMRPVEGIAASGGTWFAQVRFGVLPQVISGFASYSLLRFEINVRGAAVIGFVGAGGIGQELIVAIRNFYYADVSAILVMLIVCVMLIDFVSEKIRHRLLSFGAER
jgi:phosphonate transport system permease protein